MTDYVKARERFVELVRQKAEEVENATVEVCPRGCHLRAAHRWRTTCEGCGEPISHGAVGLATWDDERTCGKGGWSHQHGCGVWNSPVEVAVLLDAYDDRIEEIVADQDPDDVDWFLEDRLHDLAEDALNDALTPMWAEVDDEQRHAAEQVRGRLLRELAGTLIELGQDPGDEGLAAELETGSELEPGVHRDGGMWVAWDDDPRGVGDGVIVVDEDDLDLIGVNEVARITGLAPDSVRKYVHRRSMPAPLPVVHADALLWQRSDIVAWAADRLKS